MLSQLISEGAKNVESIGRSNMIIDKYFKLYFRNSLKKYNLNTAEGLILLLMMEKEMKPQYNALDKMHHLMKGQTQDQMNDEIHYDKAVMTRTMQSLESKGYVERSINPADRRSCVFFLTKKAEDFKSTLIDILTVWNDGLQKGIDKDKLEIVKTVLSQMANNALMLTKGE